jgi:hypothetical protein
MMPNPMNATFNLPPYPVDYRPTAASLSIRSDVPRRAGSPAIKYRLALFPFFSRLAPAVVAFAAAAWAEPARQWSIQELEFRGGRAHSWSDPVVRVDFQHESGRRIAVDGFWNGGELWKVRFTLPLAGRWKWTAVSPSPR